MTSPQPVDVTIDRQGVRYAGTYTIEPDVLDMITVTYHGKSRTTRAGPVGARDGLAKIILCELVTEETST
jgi:hypothetical protein